MLEKTFCTNYIPLLTSGDLSSVPCPYNSEVHVEPNIHTKVVDNFVYPTPDRITPCVELPYANFGQPATCCGMTLLSLFDDQRSTCMIRKKAWPGKVHVQQKYMAGRTHRAFKYNLQFPSVAMFLIGTIWPTIIPSINPPPTCLKEFRQNGS
jgi:hypothetical protein